MNVLLTGKKFERGESAYYIYICVWVSVLLCGSQFVCREREVVRQIVGASAKVDTIVGVCLTMACMTFTLN